MTGRTWAYEDFVEGDTLELGTKTVTAEEIIEFAGEFDAQPMHLDEEAGKSSILGGLSGAPGIDVVRWKKPVLAGDRLTGRCTVLAKRISKSRPGLGLVTLRSELFNQRGETVLELQNTVMFLARDAA